MKQLKQIGEFGLIDRIRRRTSQGADVVRGIGDDAAVLKAGRGRKLLFAIDTIVEGVDFKRGEAKPDAIGRKALAVNLSDMAAMGGRPRYAVVSMTIPKRMTLREIDGIHRGITVLAKRFGVSVVGGDLSRGRELSLTVAILGEAGSRRVVFRKGARPGDVIALTGSLGGSIFGKHVSFEPRVKEGLFLARSGISAMIDVSDGLIQDLNHLLTEHGLGYVLDESKIPVSRDVRKFGKLTRAKRLAHAYSDGEDFELLFTVSHRGFEKLTRAWRRTFRTPLTAIGTVTLKPSSRPRFRGFQHF